MERKIEIFNFASRTRMLLVRLLALVRWASSASKVNLFYISSSLHCLCVSSSSWFDERWTSVPAS